MKKRLSSIALSALCAIPAFSANEAMVSLLPAKESPIIQKEIYGQFAEHLGTCIYGGLWVGPESDIPNQNGYRLDVLNALKELHVPVLRWPGGCFADEYHWMDGIGPKSERPRMVNNNWGGTVEDNSFGTHDFFDLCELLGCEPYLSGNVGSGTVEELAKWVEYITAEDGPMATLRKKNGREKPWKLKYLGVGNESWGCGGNFTPEFYADVYRRYQTYCRNFNGNRLDKEFSANALESRFSDGAAARALPSTSMRRIGTGVLASVLRWATWCAAIARSWTSMTPKSAWACSLTNGAHGLMRSPVRFPDTSISRTLFATPWWLL